MKYSAVLPVLVVCGLVLLILAFLWPFLSEPESNWSMEEYQEYQDAVAEGHEVLHESEHARSDSSAEANQRDEKARSRLERINKKLKEAREGPQNVIQALKWSGIALVLVGGIGMLMRQSSDG